MQHHVSVKYSIEGVEMLPQTLEVPECHATRGHQVTGETRLDSIKVEADLIEQSVQTIRRERD